MRIPLILARDGDSLVRARAADGLMEIGDDQAIIGLVDMLDDPNLRVCSTWR